MKKLLFTLAILMVASVAFAQPPATAANKLGWSQDAASLTEAQGYTYKYYPDTSVAGITLNAVSCTGATSPYSCEVAFPVFTPGPHTLTLTTSNVAGESPKSLPLSFVFVVTPTSPTTLIIKK